jgi:hypothetical protein
MQSRPTTDAAVNTAERQSVDIAQLLRAVRREYHHARDTSDGDTTLSPAHHAAVREAMPIRTSGATGRVSVTVNYPTLLARCRSRVEGGACR